MSRRNRKRGTIPQKNRYVMLEHWLLDSDAFGELSGRAVKLALRLDRRHNGSNNGAIAMSVREAQNEIPCSRNHAAKCFKELEQLGFICATQKGAFAWKKRLSTTWRLTWRDCGDEQATKEFMRHDRGRRMLINGCLVDPNQKKNAVSHGETDSKTA
jgi:hypothetical protein